MGSCSSPCSRTASRSCTRPRDTHKHNFDVMLSSDRLVAFVGGWFACARLRVLPLHGDPVVQPALNEEEVDLRLDGGVGLVARELEEGAGARRQPRARTAREQLEPPGVDGCGGVQPGARAQAHTHPQPPPHAPTGLSVGLSAGLLDGGCWPEAALTSGRLLARRFLDRRGAGRSLCSRARRMW